MAVRVPQNQVVESKYTIGKEYLLVNTYKEYQGYYYELNNKFFAGKEFNTNAPELIKITSDKINNLKLNPKTSTYSNISNANLSDNKIIPSLPIVFNFGDAYLYFAKKLNSNPVKIIHISEEDYNNNLGKNLLYSYTKVECNQEWGFNITDQNIKDIPEIEIFLEQYSNNPDF
jgi:hypothetical protein